MDRRAFLRASLGAAALLTLPSEAYMATVPLPERNAAIDTLFLMVGEDAAGGGRILDFLRTAFTGFAWESILRTRIELWQPYIDSGLSLQPFADEVIRYADLFRDSRT